MSLIFIVFTGFDLLRFSDKFLPFVPSVYMYPETSALTFLQNNIGANRLLTTDNEILPPNVSVNYRLQAIEGYDSLYLQRFGQLIDYDTNKNANYNKSLPFNRIVTDESMSNKLMNFLGVKYILSFQSNKMQKLKKVFTDGKTNIFENSQAFPRAFFVNNVISLQSKDQVLQQMFSPNIDLRRTAFIEESLSSQLPLTMGEATLTTYQANSVSIETKDNGSGFLVFTDSYYPTWNVFIDGKFTKIYLTDYNYRGVLIPAGNHKIVFTDSLF